MNLINLIDLTELKIAKLARSNDSCGHDRFHVASDTACACVHLISQCAIDLISENSNTRPLYPDIVPLMMTIIMSNTQSMILHVYPLVHVD